MVQIAIEDRGNGVPEAEREVIFDRFSRGSESGNRASDSGVGLGLALVDEHVRLHGGPGLGREPPRRQARARGSSSSCSIVPLPSADDAAALSDVVTETPDSSILPEETSVP